MQACPCAHQLVRGGDNVQWCWVRPRGGVALLYCSEMFLNFLSIPSFSFSFFLFKHLDETSVWQKGLSKRSRGTPELSVLACWHLEGTKVFQDAQVVNLNGLRLTVCLRSPPPAVSISFSVPHLSLHLSLENMPPRSPIKSALSYGGF